MSRMGIPANIEIGGMLHDDAKEDLARAIVSDGAKESYSGAPLEYDETQVLIARSLSNDESLFLCDDEAANGTFKTIETVCQDHGLLYSRHTDPYDSQDGEISYFDGKQLRKMLASSTGQPLVRLDELVTARDDGTVDSIVAKCQVFQQIIPALTKASARESLALRARKAEGA